MFYTLKNTLSIVIISLIIIAIIILINKNYKKNIKPIIILSLFVSIYYFFKNLSIFHTLFSSQNIDIAFLAIFIYNALISILPLFVSLLFKRKFNKIENYNYERMKMKIKDL